MSKLEKPNIICFYTELCLSPCGCVWKRENALLFSVVCEREREREREVGVLKEKNKIKNPQIFDIWGVAHAGQIRGTRGVKNFIALVTCHIWQITKCFF